MNFYDFGVFYNVGGKVMFDFDRLYTLSKQYGVSKSHLCALAGKNASYIADLRRLHREPMPQVVSAWAAALHTTPAYLMGETDDPGEKKEPTGENASGLSDEDRELIEAFRAASPEKRQAILALLK